MAYETRYEGVNGAWPTEMPKAPLHPSEAIAAARRLNTKFRGKPFTGKFKATSGRRYTWTRRGMFYVNYTGHGRGPWQDLVHDLSHLVCRRLYPHVSGHDWRHAPIEREMIKYVVDSGWLNGVLKPDPKPEKPKPDLQAKRYEHARRYMEKWIAREKVAMRQKRKYAAKVKRYEKLFKEKSSSPELRT